MNERTLNNLLSICLYIKTVWDSDPYDHPVMIRTYKRRFKKQKKIERIISSYRIDRHSFYSLLCSLSSISIPSGHPTSICLSSISLGSLHDTFLFQPIEISYRILFVLPLFSMYLIVSQLIRYRLISTFDQTVILFYPRCSLREDRRYRPITTSTYSLRIDRLNSPTRDMYRKILSIELRIQSGKKKTS